MKKIIVDLLGGDEGQETLARGALRALEEKDLSLALIGDGVLLERLASETGADRARVEILPATDFIANTEAPTALLKGREGASLNVAYRALQGGGDALVSAGNTGAVLVGSMFKLGLIANVHRPALASALPNAAGGYTCLLDCGANVDCKSEMLLEFARLGSAFIGAYTGKEAPRVSLLSVGSEDKKGNLLTKEAFALLKDSALNFTGNCEGYDILSGKTDVVVCDGFSGNVALKLAESAGKIAIDGLRARLKTPSAEGALEEVYRMFDYNTQGGAVLLGVKKAVVKAHGAANGDTMYHCVRQAYALAAGGLAEKTEALFCKVIAE